VQRFTLPGYRDPSGGNFSLLALLLFQPKARLSAAERRGSDPLEPAQTPFSEGAHLSARHRITLVGGRPRHRAPTLACIRVSRHARPSGGVGARSSTAPAGGSRAATESKATSPRRRRRTEQAGTIEAKLTRTPLSFIAACWLLACGGNTSGYPRRLMSRRAGNAHGAPPSAGFCTRPRRLVLSHASACNRGSDCCAREMRAGLTEKRLFGCVVA